jgi:hypothetical protein
LFAWAALATGVLVALGIGILTATNNGNQFTAPVSSSSAKGTASGSASSSASAPTSGSASAPASAAPTPTATPLLDPSKIPSTTTITVLNATTTAGLAANAGTALKNGGWTVGNEGNASTTMATSVVYYDASNALNKSIALGIAQKLGIASVQQSSSFPGATIAVVLGSDYKTR